MKAIVSLSCAFILACGAAAAATITNGGDSAVTVGVTERGTRTEILVEPGETQSFCHSGCFISWGDGDRAALHGNEHLSIRGGSVSFLDGG